MSEVETATLTDEDKQLITALLVELYGRQAESWTVNNEIAHVVEAILREMESCSDAFDYVPSPHGITKPGLAYIKKQLRKIVERQAKRHILQIKKQAIPCKKYTALAWRRAIDAAVMGI